MGEKRLLVVRMLIMFLEVVEVFDDENGFGEEDEGGKEACYICSGASCASPPLSGSHVPQPMVETTKWSLDLAVTDVNEA